MRRQLIILAFALAFGNVMGTVHAADIVDKGLGLPFQGDGEGQSASYIANIIKEMIKYIGVLAVMALTYGGILMMLSYGDESKVKGAKKVVTYALLGIVVSGAAWLIVDILNSIKLS